MRRGACGGKWWRQSMALQTLAGTLPCRMEFMDAVFGDLFLNVGRHSLLTFPFEVGDGTTISFWHNQWVGEGLLKDLFPSLYALA